jgi:hypothetical protein
MRLSRGFLLGISLMLGAPMALGQAFEGYNFAEYYGSNGINSALASTICTSIGCFLIASPAYVSSENIGPYKLSPPSSFARFAGSASYTSPETRLAFIDDRGFASAREFRDPIQATISPQNHTAYSHNCLFSTPYEPLPGTDGGSGAGGPHMAFGS